MTWQLITFAVLITTYSLVGLVAVWGALGRGHWFVRIAAVQLFLAIWLAAPDSHFWVAFFVQSALVIAVLLSIRRVKGASSARAAAPNDAAAAESPPTFSLKDLFLLTLASAGVLMVLARIASSMQSQWLPAVATGAGLAVFTLMGVWTAAARRIWVRLAMLALFFPGALIALWLWLARSCRGGIGRAAAIAGLLLIAAPPVAFYAWLIQPQFITLPEPLAENGMDDLMRAGEMVASPAVDVSALSGEALQDYLQHNQAALELASAGLARPCQIDLATHGLGFTQAEFDRTSNLRQLGRVLAASGRNHLESGDLDGAVDDYFQVVQLGDATMHGGVMLHEMMGAAIQGAGFQGLRELTPQLDAAACQELERRLLKLDAEEEAFDDIALREWRSFQKRTPWAARWTLMQVPQLWEQSRQAAEWAYLRSQAWRQLLRTHLALRRFWLAERKYPETLDELNPAFLPAAPLDPFSGRSLVYRPTPEGYRLYSVGQDGVDDGGKPIAPGSGANPAQGDLMLDVTLVGKDGNRPQEATQAQASD